MIRDSFVALSDFHSFDFPLEKVKKYYLYEYDKIFILGDATDRGMKDNGENGVRILLEIKRLSEKYPNRVIYIPGNHDQFIYVAYKYKSENARRNIAFNGGEATLRDLDAMLPSERDELIDWLGSLPIQVKHRFRGKTYAFAHAFFNDKIYNIDPKLSLRDYSPDNYNSNSRYTNILWFRKYTPEHNNYRPSDLPDRDTIMVVGHTPDAEETDISLTNEKGEKITVHCVDTNGKYTGTMLKYDGSSSVRKTQIISHNDTSPKVDDNYDSRLRSAAESLNFENNFKNFIKDFLIYFDCNIKLLKKCINDYLIFGYVSDDFKPLFSRYSLTKEELEKLYKMKKGRNISELSKRLINSIDDFVEYYCLLFIYTANQENPEVKLKF